MLRGHALVTVLPAVNRQSLHCCSHGFSLTQFLCLRRPHTEALVWKQQSSNSHNLYVQFFPTDLLYLDRSFSSFISTNTLKFQSRLFHKHFCKNSLIFTEGSTTWSVQGLILNCGNRNYIKINDIKTEEIYSTTATLSNGRYWRLVKSHKHCSARQMDCINFRYMIIHIHKSTVLIIYFLKLQQNEYKGFQCTVKQIACMPV